MELLAVLQNCYICIPQLLAKLLTMLCSALVAKHWPNNLWGIDLIDRLSLTQVSN
jgi:hypothetical protein